MAEKDIDSTQLDLFGFDPKDKEKYEKEHSENKKKQALHRQSIRIKKEKQLEEFEYASQEKYFLKALEQTKQFLSWGRVSSKSKKTNYFSKLPAHFFSEDLFERESWKYELWFERKNLTFNTYSAEENKSIFEIKWILPLFEEAMGFVADKYMIYPTFEDYQTRNFIDFEDENAMYEQLIDSCRKLLDPELNDDYFLSGVRFNVRKGFKSIYYDKEEDLNLYQPENLESMNLSQENNVLTFQWMLPEEIFKVRIADNDEFYYCFKYWLQ